MTDCFGAMGFFGLDDGAAAETFYVIDSDNSPIVNDVGDNIIYI